MQNPTPQNIYEEEEAFQFLGVFLGVLLIAFVAVGTSSRAEEERRYDTPKVFSGAHASSRRFPPEETKGIYLTAWTAADPVRRAELFELVEKTELNTVVIDIKDSEGKIAYESQVPFAVSHELVAAQIQDLEELLRILHGKDIWVIARLVVFQDPALVRARPDLAIQSKRTKRPWKNYRGISWVDPASKEVWRYHVAITKEAFRFGFDEVQLDYIRFPSDGDLTDLSYPVWEETRPKHEVIRSFFAFLRKKTGNRAILSADLFGMTFLKTDAPDDDLGIGQRLVDAVPYFDYVSPMVYPSHYPSGFEGFVNPAEHPYEVISRTLAHAAPFLEGTRIKVRPWLQDFDLGAYYTPTMIRAQVKAAQEHGSAGWLLWNATNRYTAGGLLSAGD